MKTLGVTVIVVLSILSSISYAEDKVEYLGVDYCKTCHMPHYESWHETKMSKAFELLKPGIRRDAKVAANVNPDLDYSKDPKCLVCHTTGYGEPGGFVNLSTTPEMVGVQCEMCHGPGSRYSKMMYKKKGTFKREDFIKEGLTLPTEQNNICTNKCHNDKSPFVRAINNYNFSFEFRKDMGTHRHDLKYIYMDIELF